MPAPSVPLPGVAEKRCGRVGPSATLQTCASTKTTKMESIDLHSSLSIDVVVHHLLPYCNLATLGKLVRCNTILYTELHWNHSLMPLINVLIGSFGQSRVVLETVQLFGTNDVPNKLVETVLVKLLEKNPLPRVVIQSLRRQITRLRSTQTRFRNQMQTVSLRTSLVPMQQHFAMAKTDSGAEKLERCQVIDHVLTPVALVAYSVDESPDSRDFETSFHHQDDRRMFLSMCRTIHEFHEHTAEWHRTMGAEQAWQAHVSVLTTLLELLRRYHFPVSPTSLDVVDLQDGYLMAVVHQCFNPVATMQDVLVHLDRNGMQPPAPRHQAVTIDLLRQLWFALLRNGFMAKDWNVAWSNGRDACSVFVRNAVRSAYRRHQEAPQGADCGCEWHIEQTVYSTILQPNLLPFLQHLIERHNVSFNRNFLLKEFVPPLVAAGCKHHLRDAVDWITSMTGSAVVEKRRRSSMVRLGFDEPCESEKLTQELLARHLRNVPRTYRGPVQTPDTYGIKIMLEAGLIDPQEGLDYLANFLSSWQRMSDQEKDPAFPASLEYFLLNSGVEDGSLAAYLALGQEMEAFANVSPKFAQWLLLKCLSRGYLVGTVTCLQRGAWVDDEAWRLMQNLSVESQQKLWPTLLRTVKPQQWKRLALLLPHDDNLTKREASDAVLLHGVLRQCSPQRWMDVEKILGQAKGMFPVPEEQHEEVTFDATCLQTSFLPRSTSNTTPLFEATWFQMEF